MNRIILYKYTCLPDRMFLKYVYDGLFSLIDVYHIVYSLNIWYYRTSLVMNKINVYVHIIVIWAKRFTAH